MISKEDFEKQLQSLADQGALMQRLCKINSLNGLADFIGIEADRLTQETAELNKKGKSAGLI